MESPNRFQLGGCEPECLSLTSVALLLPWILTVVRSESPPTGVDSRPKELIYGHLQLTSMQLISQGIQEVANRDLDTQIGLQKKSSV